MKFYPNPQSYEKACELLSLVDAPRANPESQCYPFVIKNYKNLSHVYDAFGYAFFEIIKAVRVNNDWHVIIFTDKSEDFQQRLDHLSWLLRGAEILRVY